MWILAAVAIPGIAQAQDALRTAVQGDRAYESRRAGFPVDAHQLRAGPVRFTAGLSFSAEWNDNIRTESVNPKEDVILRPNLNLLVFAPVSKDSRISFGAGIGYQFYTRYTEYNRLDISPNSELAWDVPYRDFVFTFYDRFTYSQDVISEGAISGQADYPRFENTIGTRARWNPGRMVYHLGYGHYNYIADSDRYDYLTRSAEQFFGRAGYQLQPATEVGLEVSSGLTDYDDPTRNDNVNISLGPYLDWQVTRAIRLGLRGGYVIYQFDQANVPGITGQDLTSYYLGLDATHRINDYFNHSLSATRDVQAGINQGSDYIERLSVNYSIRWQMTRYATLSLNAFYEHSQEPPVEDYDRMGFGPSISYRLIGRLSPSLSYRYTKKDSTALGRDYSQNSVTLSASYSF